VNGKRILILGVFVVAIALAGATIVVANDEAPNTPVRPSGILQNGALDQFNYQGLLLDAASDPVPDGDYDLTFAIYDVPTEGTALWSETQTVAVAEGLFNVLLGASTPISPTDWIDGRDLWLGITVAGDAEMAPRQQLVSVPYAMNANDVRGSDIHPLSVYIAGYGQVIDENGQ